MIQAALIALIAFLAYMGDALGYSQYEDVYKRQGL